MPAAAMAGAGPTARHSKRATSAAIAMSAGIEIAFTARRSASPSIS
jgi:hypothetical protein